MGLEQAKQYQDRAKWLVANNLCCSMGEARRIASYDTIYKRIVEKFKQEKKKKLEENKNGMESIKENDISNTNG
jgi:hypothetical protein